MFCVLYLCYSVYSMSPSYDHVQPPSGEVDNRLLCNLAWKYRESGHSFGHSVLHIHLWSLRP